MKKLMLLVAVAGLAFASQAAQFDWQYGATASDVGKTVYVVLGSTPQTTWESVDALAAAAVSNGTVARAGRNTLASGIAVDPSITTSSANAYYVVVSADKSSFDVSNVADFSGSVYDPSDPNNSTTKGDNKSISSSSTFVATGSSFGGGGTTPSVPEPTSGLLMIVGLGALALRRRRA